MVLGPELEKKVERGIENGEAFRPHEFGEEGGDASAAVAGDAVGGASGFELLVKRKREQGKTSSLNVGEELHGDAMVNNLEHSPCSACMPYQLYSIRLLQIDHRNTLVICISISIGILLCPCVRIWEILLQRVEIRVVLVVKVHRVSSKSFGE